MVCSLKLRNLQPKNQLTPRNIMENRYLRNVGPSLWDGAKASHYPGNVRAVVNDADSVEQVNHYYPFGILMGESRGGDVD